MDERVVQWGRPSFISRPAVPSLVPLLARRYPRKMKPELLLFLMLAAGAVGTACGADAGSSSTAGAGGGDSTTVGTVGSSSQTGVGSSGTGAGAGTTSGAGGSGGGPADCAATAACGNFGGGCIKCAAKTACAAEYTACFNNAPCKAYSACIEPCGVKDVDCLQQCQNQSPTGATEYLALIRCVICGDCVTLCEHAPDTCN